MTSSFFLESNASAAIKVRPANTASPHPVKNRVPGFPRMSGLDGKSQ
ncbi:hypothetical protein ACFE6N_13665 [Pedobacter sp. BG31]